MDTLGLFLPMMMLSSKTRDLMEKSNQDSFTADEIAELMAKAISLCIAEVKKMSDDREEKKNAPADKEQRDGE